MYFGELIEFADGQTGTEEEESRMALKFLPVNEHVIY